MNTKKAAIVLAGLISFITLFHLLILVKIIPYQITWGGRLHNDKEMYAFEAVSILLNVFFGWVVLMKGGLIRFRLKDKILKVILWAFFFLFVLNTIGNLFAETLFEKSFSIVTLMFVVLLYVILKSNRTKVIQ